MVNMVTSDKLLSEYIVSTPGTLGGRPRIAGRRIAVQHIFGWYENMGYSARKIAQDYDLTMGEVFAALAYYWEHKEEMEDRKAEDDRFVAEMMAQNPSRLYELANERGIEIPKWLPNLNRWSIEQAKGDFDKILGSLDLGDVNIVASGPITECCLISPSAYQTLRDCYVATTGDSDTFPELTSDEFSVTPLT